MADAEATPAEHSGLSDPIMTDPDDLADWIERQLSTYGYQRDGYPRDFGTLRGDEWAIIIRALRLLPSDAMPPNDDRRGEPASDAGA